MNAWSGPLSMSMAPNKDYLQGWNNCHKHMAEEIVRQDAQIESLKRLLKRCQTPLRFASMHYLDEGLLGQEHKAALKGRP